MIMSTNRRTINEAMTLRDCAAAVLDAERVVSGRVRGLKELLSPEDYAGLMLDLGVLANETARLCAGAGTGMIEEPRPQMDPEMLESLHRAGDHTLDEDEEDAAKWDTTQRVPTHKEVAV